MFPALIMTYLKSTRYTEVNSIISVLSEMGVHVGKTDTSASFSLSDCVIFKPALADWLYNCS